MLDKQPPKPTANESLIEAFTCTYTLVSNEGEAEEVFDYAKLRQFFGAIPLPKMPDPLPPYIDRLQEEGFLFRLSWSGDPALFVRRINQPTIIHPCPSLFDDDNDDDTPRYDNDDDTLHYENDTLRYDEDGDVDDDASTPRLIDISTNRPVDQSISRPIDPDELDIEGLLPSVPSCDASQEIDDDDE